MRRDLNLEPRLMAVAGFVPAGRVVADIGADHAYLGIWLVLRGRVPKVVATEASAGPAQRALKNIRRYGVEDRVEVRVGSGLGVLCPGEAEVLVMAGMGGQTMISILESGGRVLEASKRLVLQPMTGAGKLRKWLVSKGFRFLDEVLVEEKGRFYEVICVEAGTERVDDEILFEIGPVIWRKPDPLLRRFLRQKLSRYRQLLKMTTTMANSENPGAKGAAQAFREKCEVLEAMLSCLPKSEG